MGASLDAFYERLGKGGVATTSQPPAEAFESAFATAAERGADEVLSIHLDARVSGTVDAARRAAEASPIRVHVVDSGTVSFGVAVCVRAAAAALAHGGGLLEARDAAMQTGASLRTAFVARPDRAGRIPSFDGWVVFTHRGGAFVPVHAASSADEAVGVMAGLVLDDDAPLSVAVGHAGAGLEPAADELAHRLVGVEGVQGVERYRVGAAVGAHTGPDSFGLFWWPGGR